MWIPSRPYLPFCVVAGRRDASPMDVLEAAAERGFELEERPLRGQWVWGWRRGDDAGWPCFLSEREALSYMADRLRSTAVFV
jgi:hypothetical protein